MAHSCANPRAEGVQDDLSNNEEEDAKGDITKRPTVLQRAGNQQDLHTKVHSKLNRVKQVEDDEKSDGVRGAQANSRLKSRQRDEEGNGEGHKRADSQHPNTERGSIFVELEANKTIDKQCRNHCTGETILYRHKVRVRLRTGRHNTRVYHQREEGQQHVQVKEGQDLLSPHSRELAPHVQNHDDGHDKSENVNNGRRAFEDDSVGEFDVARETVCLDADARCRRQRFTQRGAEGERCILADGGEVTEAGHVRGW